MSERHYVTGGSGTLNSLHIRLLRPKKVEQMRWLLLCVIPPFPRLLRMLKRAELHNKPSTCPFPQQPSYSSTASLHTLGSGTRVAPSLFYGPHKPYLSALSYNVFSAIHLSIQPFSSLRYRKFPPDMRYTATFHPTAQSTGNN